MDQLVASAVAHWGPRFTVNGVTVADFGRATAGLERWDDWCARWSDIAAEHEQLGREALAGGRDRSAGEHLAQAAVYFHFAKFVFVRDLDQMHAAHQRAVACLTDALPHLDPPGRRVVRPFEDTELVAVLRTPGPAHGAGPHPVVVLLSGLDSAKEELRTTEQTFLDRGLATLTLDGPGQGEAERHLPIRADWSAVAEWVWDAVGAEPSLDRSRLGVWGVSLGGYYAPRVAAALGERCGACVSLSGPFNFGECWDGLPELTRETFRVRSGSATDDDARRVALGLGMADTAADLVAPLLAVTGRHDRLIPWDEAGRLAAAVSGPAEVLALDGNHGCADVAPWHRPRTADWLAAHLASPAAGPRPDPPVDHGLVSSLPAPTPTSKAGP